VHVSGRLLRRCVAVRPSDPGSAAIRAADRLATESHLDAALRHLETARVLAVQLDGDDMNVLDRLQLNDVAAEAGVLIEQITRALSGVDLDGEFARLFDLPDTGSPPT
jgi:hypothetical protein